MMPASRATPSTSPFAAPPARIIASVSGRITTRHPRGGGALGFRLAADIDHDGVARRVEMGEAGAHRRTAEQGPGGRGHVSLTHQAFADQEAR